MNATPTTASTPPPSPPAQTSARTRLGVSLASYSVRSRFSRDGSLPPGESSITDPVAMLEYTHSLGAAGLQLGVDGWKDGTSRRLRGRAEALGMYLEGQIGLPKPGEDPARFEAAVKEAREAGIVILRAVAMGGRRYETLDSAEAFSRFQADSWKAITAAEKIARRHDARLAIENHKDWRTEEQVELLRHLSSEFVGVTLDLGNNLALLEDPVAVARTLAPWTITTHFKDMAMEPSEHGFFLSEVPLGKGILDLRTLMQLCMDARPEVRFNLEMITRDPLEIPCLTDRYWATLGGVPASRLAALFRTLREHPPRRPLTRTAGLSPARQLALEEANNRECLAWARQHLAGG